MDENGSKTRALARKAALVVLIATAPVLIWIFRDLILLTTGALTVAALLHVVSIPLRRWVHLPRSLALALAGFVILAVAVGVSWIFGSQVSSEISDVVARAQSSIEALRPKLTGGALGSVFGDSFLQGISIPSYLGSVAMTTMSALEGLVVILVAAAYIAAEPELYGKGIVGLFPRGDSDDAADMLHELAVGMQLWLLGQLIQMILVGLLSFFAMWMLGVPSPIGLGVIAAACEFVPYVGPIIASVPAVLVAFSQSTSLVLWTVLAYLVIHQVEGQLFVPLIQRRLVDVPPAVMLLGIVAVQTFFGFIGVLFAGPIVVLVYFAVKRLYVNKGLGKDVHLPGEGSSGAVISGAGE